MPGTPTMLITGSGDELKVNDANVICGGVVTQNATVYDRPEEGIPLYVAASGATAARLAGRVADGTSVFYLMPEHPALQSDERLWFLPTDDESDCRFCDYADVCRVRVEWGEKHSPRARWSTANLVRYGASGWRRTSNTMVTMPPTSRNGR